MPEKPSASPVPTASRQVLQKDRQLAARLGGSIVGRFGFAPSAFGHETAHFVTESMEILMKGQDVPPVLGSLLGRSGRSKKDAEAAFVVGSVSLFQRLPSRKAARRFIHP